MWQWSRHRIHTTLDVGQVLLNSVEIITFVLLCSLNYFGHLPLLSLLQNLLFKLQHLHCQVPVDTLLGLKLVGGSFELVAKLTIIWTCSVLLLVVLVLLDLGYLVFKRLESFRDLLILQHFVLKLLLSRAKFLLQVCLSLLELFLQSLEFFGTVDCRCLLNSNIFYLFWDFGSWRSFHLLDRLGNRIGRSFYWLLDCLNLLHLVNLGDFWLLALLLLDWTGNNLLWILLHFLDRL
jgi:hypothetical protein